MFDNDNYNEEDFIKIALNKIYIIKKFFSDNLNEKKYGILLKKSIKYYKKKKKFIILKMKKIYIDKNYFL